MNPHLHIIALDNPWPPDYGGAIDMYYKIRALAAEGVKIDLHLFAYGRNDTGDLADMVHSLHIYPRRRSPLALFSSLPFIVRTRMNASMVKNILQNPAPVLFEGIHTTGILPQLADLPVFLRVHNVEQNYYDYLARNETNFFRRSYYRRESRKLEQYEPKIWAGVKNNFCLHPTDTQHVSAYGQAVEIPVFHPFDRVEIDTGKTEKFVLFHGNLSVIENQKAVFFLWKKVVRPLGIRMVVAGKNPPEALKALARQNPHLGLVANPSTEQMERLIRQAYVHLIYSDNPSGMKLKLLYALFRGKHILVSLPLVEETVLTDLTVAVENKAAEWRNRLRELWHTEPDVEAARKIRSGILGEHYDNRINARKIMAYVR